MISKYQDLKNKNVIITGGSGFIGKQISRAFLNQGSKVYVLDLKTFKSSRNLKYFKTDITDSTKLQNVLAYLKKRKINIDILINNAANDYKPNGKKISNLTLENFSNQLWDLDLNIGLKGSYLCTKVFGSYMAKKKSGIILNVASDLGIIAPNQDLYNKKNFIKPVTYSVVKHGIIGLTKYTASYWAKKNIRCNAIAPGGIMNGQDTGFIKKINKLIPMGRMAKKNEYNDLILFLCSKASSYMTGSIVVADGGRTII
tara:strand:+ start:1815 stop:2585 length:771 start_codon:yes stop_codon:yes gene_type:complete